jgi:hypothetical protein
MYPCCGMIERIPQTHRYQVTDFGFRAALFFTRTHARLYRPGFAEVLPELPNATPGWSPKPDLNAKAFQDQES